ncbi:MAG: TetR/AcrR family transcriptional regulator [Lentisphaerae bacterium]|nr:TetR/AcrR family transcriptional regulator [Lentisphaerota bacterium]MCP4101652.1 TetR/AcrR family transcriptional regulator [Lentisphaerota bacterium]
MSAEATKNRIVETASQVFAEKGYDETTIRDIAALADVNLASVSYHFGGKKELYRRAVEYLLEDPDEVEMFTRIQQINDEASFKKVCREEINNILECCREDSKMLNASKIMSHEIYQPSEAFKEVFLPYIRTFMKEMMALLSLGLPEDTDSDKLFLRTFMLFEICYHFGMKVEFFKDIFNGRDFVKENEQTFGDMVFDKFISELEYNPASKTVISKYFNSNMTMELSS